MFGVLNLNKPPGKTSRDVVNVVQRLVKPLKAGHAGTLDPLATGVLLVCVGSATRLISYAQRLQKEYRSTFRLGERSNTEDVEGERQVLDNPVLPTREQLTTVLPKFIGEIEQTPPAFSALKIKGRRAYTLARAGEAVELAPRPITIYSIEIVRYEYPELVLDVCCGSGTYIRSLGRDIAQAAGTEAVMSALCRTAIGPFRVDRAIEPDELDGDTLPKLMQPAKSLLGELPSVTLSDHEIEEISLGRYIDDRFDRAGEELSAFDSDGKLLAILTKKRTSHLGPKLNFVGKG